MTTLPGLDLDQYRAQAKDLLRLALSADPQAIGRIHSQHPEHGAAVSGRTIKLADAQLVIARELGFGSWPKLKAYLLFRNALAALDSGDIARLSKLIHENPTVLTYRCRRGDWYESGYFQGAALLNHIAGNPIRCPLPANIIEVTRTLLDNGADPNIATESAWTTIGLLLTGKQAADAGVAVTLIDMLKAAGAKDDVETEDVLSGPLWNAARSTAEELVRRGAKMDIRHAAALGRLDLMEGFLESERDPSKIEEALIYASQQGEALSASLLLQRGAKGDVFVSTNNSSAGHSYAANVTALHTAASFGHAEVVRLLLDHGANPAVIEPTYNGTARDWAVHGGHSEIAEILADFSGTNAGAAG